MMHRRTVVAALVLAPLAGRAESRLQVVASFSILADMARQIGGEAVSVEALVGPDGDAHVYEPRPRDLRTVMSARLLVRNGLGLEGWMDRLTGAAGYRGKVVVAAESVAPRTMKEEGGAIATDPHAWQDPRNAILYTQAIAAGLASVDPLNASLYSNAATHYRARIAQTDAWVESMMTAIPASQRRIITTHDAFGYYGARYGVEFLSAEGISTQFEPSAKAITALVRQIRRETCTGGFHREHGKSSHRSDAGA